MSFWEKTLVSPSNTLMEGINILHQGGCRIALVVDEELRLLGTVTDGDIRRALISNVPMNSPITAVMNKDPLTADSGVNPAEVLSLLRSQDLLHIPIVNKANVLCDLITLQQAQEKPLYDNPVFIMAGGFGKRLYPLTNDTPKPLLKVGDKPILDTIIGQFVHFGFNNFYISTHYLPEKIKNNFKNKDLGDITINFIQEDNPLGTAGSLGLLPDDISKLPLIMMNGDLLTKVDFRGLLDFHSDHKSKATMCVREYDFQVPYGVIEIKKNRVTGIKEKPKYKFFVNAGIYVLDHNLIKKIDGKKYLDITNFLESELDKGGVRAFPIHEYWLDIGQIDEYNQANRDIETLF